MKKRIKVIVALTGLTLGTLHIINRVVTSTSTSKEILPQPNSSTFKWRFGEIHYTKKGSGTIKEKLSFAKRIAANINDIDDLSISAKELCEKICLFIEKSNK